MEQFKRPSNKEILSKLNAAGKANDENKIIIINPDSFLDDFNELGVSLKIDLHRIFNELLKNTKAENYVGHRPPQKSYKDQIKNMELFAFKTISNSLEVEIYFKFAIKNDYCYLVSLHKDKPK